MKYLITGGAGFIGGNFIEYMLQTYPDCEIVCFDALTYAGNLRTLRKAETFPNFFFVRGDICDASAVRALFARHRFDMAVNFAAESHVDNSISAPELFLKTNVLGVQTLLDACLQYGCARFHQVSTDEVYGDLPLGRPDLSFAESARLNPSSPYAASKAAADLLVSAYARTYGIAVTISRSSNNYGPYQHPEKFIPSMTLRALKGETLPIYGDGKNVRDWLHVCDHCAAIDAVIHKGRPGEIYNIGGRNECGNLPLAKRILALARAPQSLIAFVRDRPGHDLRYSLDSRKIEQELGWRPRVPFEEGLRETVEWYRRNGAWVASCGSAPR